MRRRDFFGVAAAIPGVAAAARIDVASIKPRGPKKVEIVYKSPHARPNGLQATAEGMWVMDQGTANDCTLINYADGRVIRDFKINGADAASGIGVDASGDLWVTSSHNSLILKCSAQDGKVLAKYWCHGAGRPYRLKGDPAATRSPLESAFPAPTPAAGGRGRGGRGGGAALPFGQLPLDAPNGVGNDGGQGIEFRDGLMYYSVLPARMLYVVDPKTWEAQATWPLAGNRAHGVGWDGDTLWVADTNWRAFFRHDMKTGAIVEKIQLTEKDPLIHGVTVHDGYMWFCDDVGYVCNFKL
jgi:streptogramin lyase